jgi:hypothetical protein
LTKLTNLCDADAAPGPDAAPDARPDADPMPTRSPDADPMPVPMPMLPILFSSLFWVMCFKFKLKFKKKI